LSGEKDKIGVWMRRRRNWRQEVDGWSIGNEELWRWVERLWMRTGGGKIRGSIETEQKWNAELREKNSVAWVRERTIPTARLPLVGEVIANICR
jgi:hypothetical protein